MAISNTSITQRGASHSSLQPFAKALLQLIGWQVEGTLPDVPKFVLIVYPHTSNWDLPIGLLCAHALGLLSGWRYGYMAKDSIFRGPSGPFFRWLGAIPINRRSATNVVDQMVAVFDHYETLMVAITPEGTRSKTPHWKSGFYHIALGAKVPIVLAFLDYKRRVGGLGPMFTPGGDINADLDLIRQFYGGVAAKFPHKAGEIRLRE